MVATEDRATVLVEEDLPLVVEDELGKTPTVWEQLYPDSISVSLRRYSPLDMGSSMLPTLRLPLEPLRAAYLDLPTDASFGNF